MKRLVPSTPGELAVVVERRIGKLTSPKQFAKFMSVREVVNRLIAEHDIPDNPIVSICIEFTVKGAA